MEDIVHVGCHTQTLQACTAQPCAVLEVVVGGEAGEVEHIVALDEARGGVGRGGRRGDVLVEGHIAGVVPGVAEDAAIDIVGNIHVLHAINERLVVVVATQLIAEEQAQADALVLAIEAEGAVHLGVSVACDDVVIGGVGEGGGAVLLAEQLATRGGVDAERLHCPDGRHGLSLLVADDGRRGVLCVLVVVEAAEGIADVGDLVDIMRDAAREAHVGLSFLEEAPVQRGLDAAVLHIAQVLHVSVETCRRGDGHGDEGIVGAAVVVVEAHIQAFPQPEVETHGEVARLLPLQVGVRHPHEVGTGDVAVDDVVVELIRSLGLIGREVLVAREAIGHAELTQRQPRGLLHEVLLMEVPTHAGTPEGTPAVVAAEDGGAVEAQADIGQIALIVAIVGSTRDTQRARGGLGARGLAALGILLGEGDVIDVVVQEAPGCHTLGAAVGCLQRVGGIGQQHVLVPGVGIVTCDVDVQAVRLAVGDVVAAALEVALARPFREARVVARVEVLTFVVLMREAQSCREAQVGDGAVFEVEVLHYLRVFREVLGAYLRVVERVVVGPRTAAGAGCREGAEDLLRVAELIRGREVGVHASVVGEGAIGAVVGAIASDGQLVAEHPLLVAVAEVNASGNGGAVGLLHHARHIIIHNIGRVTHLLAATLHVSRVLVADAGAQGL